MKKILLGTLLLFMIVILSGCTDKKCEFDMKEACDKIENKISGLEEIKKESLEDVYNIDFSNVEEYVFKQYLELYQQL